MHLFAQYFDEKNTAFSAVEILQGDHPINFFKKIRKKIRNFNIFCHRRVEYKLNFKNMQLVAQYFNEK